MSSEYEIRLTRSAARDLRKLPKDLQSRIKQALEALQSDPLLGKDLRGELKGLRSYRSATYRVIYQVREAQLVVLVIAIGHRRDIYERARRRES